jgi:peroxin-1
MVIATASDSSALHPLLNTKHIFGETIKIAPLSKEGRRDVSTTMIAELMSGLVEFRSKQSPVW